MGNQTFKKQYPPFNLAQYTEIPSKAHEIRASNYRILKNNKSGMQMEEYHVQFNSKSQFQDYFQAFKWRLNQDNIVNTLYFIQNNKNQFCSTAYAALIYTERIPIKLSDIKDIPFPDNLYVLMACIEGFQVVYQKTDYFDIEQTLICINNDSRVKVWINSDLSKNYPQELFMNDDQKDQRDMVQKIIQLIDSNTDQPSQPISIPQYFAEQCEHEPTFAQARLILKQYAKEYKVTIPNRFESILEYLNNDQNDEEGTQNNNPKIVDTRKYNDKTHQGIQPFKVGNVNPIDHTKTSEFLYNKNQVAEQKRSYLQNQMHHQHPKQLQYSYDNSIKINQPNSNFMYFTKSIQNPPLIQQNRHNIIQFSYQQPNTSYQYQKQSQPYTIIRSPEIHTIHQSYPIQHQQMNYPVIANNQYIQLNSQRIPNQTVLQQPRQLNHDNRNILQLRNNYQVQSNRQKLYNVNNPKIQKQRIVTRVQEQQKQSSQFYDQDQYNRQQIAQLSEIKNQRNQLNQMNKMNQLNQMNQINETNQSNQSNQYIIDNNNNNNKNKNQIIQQNKINNNKTNLVSTIQNRYINRDINQDFNKYRQISSEFDSVRLNKDQIVKSAQIMLEMRQKQSKKIQQQRMEIQQQPKQSVFYHSIQQYHELDPEIAKDLIDMNI